MVKYWPQKGKAGFIVWRYLLRRDDPAPAPWTKEGKKRMEEGGWAGPSAVRAATKYATKALGLGGAWTKWNDFTERWEFKYVKTPHLDTYENKWSHYTEFNTPNKGKDAAPAV